MYDVHEDRTQPQIATARDRLRIGLARWQSRADWMTRNIRIELAAIGRTDSTDQRKAGARAWIVYAQGARREAVHNAGTYRRMIAAKERLNE